MVWLIIVCIFIFLLYRFPTFRVIIFIIGVIIAIIIGITIYSSNAKFKESKSLIPANQIELTNLTLNKGSYLYQLHGEVKNNSSYELQDITFAVKAYDCPSSTITSECVTVGEDNDVSTYIVVPPNQVRSLNDVTYVNFDNMPTIKGTFLWSYNIIGTIAK
ncbi:MAG: hypothetical protein WCK29_03295 [archaeon]